MNILKTTVLWTGICLFASQSAFAQETIPWQNLDSSVFMQAKKEHKLVLLDLEAVWCHWCHVMDQSTYSNPTVRQEMNLHFIPVRVDQDARPDLANRFRDYGWPATIIFDPDGKPLVKRAGYIEPEEMIKTMRQIATHPIAEDESTVSSGDKIASSIHGVLSAALRQTLQADHLSLYDKNQGSWGVGGHKFLDADSVEYAMKLAQLGDGNAKHMAQKTLSAELNLIDPVWGGVYQYSTGGVWTNPHTEKIMSVQVDALRMYSQAYAMWHRPADLKAAQSIQHYLTKFLTAPDGAFYTSQDADVTPGQHNSAYFSFNDSERRKLGIPKVDQHQYARENGWAIQALLVFYQATGDRSALDAGIKAAQWNLEHRSLPNGGFRHDEMDDVTGPYLGDSLAMGQAFLSLYTSTADRHWLALSQQTADFIDQQFKSELNQAGYRTATHVEPNYTDRLENLRLARWTNLLGHVTGIAKYHHMTEQAMQYVAQNEVAEDGFPAAPLLVDAEMQQAPLHITIVGSKQDTMAQQLFQQALRTSTAYKRLDWLDTTEGPLNNNDVVYPNLNQAAAFICTNHRCSLPILKPEDLNPRIEQLSKNTHVQHQSKP